MGEGAKSIFQRFKKVILSAIDHDVMLKDLTYKNIDYANKLLKFEQNKTKGHSAQWRSSFACGRTAGRRQQRRSHLQPAFVWKLLQIRQALGEKSRDRQAHKLALRPPLIRREYSQQWGEHQDGCQPARA